MSADVAPVQGKSRDSTWDIARGIGMSLVIYGHFLEPLYPEKSAIGREMIQPAFDQWQVIYSFHMMLFFLVSGAVNKSLTDKRMREVFRSSARLLALAWLVHLMGVVVEFVRDGVPQTPIDAWRSVFEPIVEGYCWSVGVLWFLTSLCFVQFIAYVILKRVHALAVVAGAMAATALVVYFDASNIYLFRTWMPGLSFFALGYYLSRLHLSWRPWLWLPLALGVIFLAPLNDGCAYTLQNACDRWDGPFGVRMFGGQYGFLPTFFATALVGALSVVCLSRGLAQFKVGSWFAYIGRSSLDLFIINGFVATFSSSTVGDINATSFNSIDYLLAAVLIVALHVLVQRALRVPLARLDGLALMIATVISGSRPFRSASYAGSVGPD